MMGRGPYTVDIHNVAQITLDAINAGANAMNASSEGPGILPASAVDPLFGEYLLYMPTFHAGMWSGARASSVGASTAPPVISFDPIILLAIIFGLWYMSQRG